MTISSWYERPKTWIFTRRATKKSECPNPKYFIRVQQSIVIYFDRRLTNRKLNQFNITSIQFYLSLLCSFASSLSMLTDFLGFSVSFVVSSSILLFIIVENILQCHFSFGKVKHMQTCILQYFVYIWSGQRTVAKDTLVLNVVCFGFRVQERSKHIKTK